MSSDPVIERAIRIRNRLADVARELRYVAAAATTSARRELGEMDAKTCDEAAEMLAKLGTEVARLRLSIGHFQYGRMSREDLIRAPRTWNGDRSPTKDTRDG